MHTIILIQFESCQFAVFLVTVNFTNNRLKSKTVVIL